MWKALARRPGIEGPLVPYSTSFPHWPLSPLHQRPFGPSRQAGVPAPLAPCHPPEPLWPFKRMPLLTCQDAVPGTHRTAVRSALACPRQRQERLAALNSESAAGESRDRTKINIKIAATGAPCRAAEPKRSRGEFGTGSETF